MKKKARLIILFICFLFPAITANSQTLNLNASGLIDIYRRSQLLGQVDSTISFTIQPLYKESLEAESRYSSDSSSSNNYLQAAYAAHDIYKGKINLKILPIIWNQQYNTNHPEGFNDGAMIPARGYQTLVSAGFFAKYGPLSIQLMPELVFSHNSKYAGFSPQQSDEIWARYYQNYLNEIDIPERFGEKSYTKLHWGQSNIRLTHKAVSVGLSSENVWWGPGRKNSLIMSNTATGFNHITLNTVKPIKTFIGHF